MKKRIWIVLISIILVMSLFHIPFSKALVFYQGQPQKLLAYLPLQDGDTFQIIFTHSIHLSDVVEKYRVTTEDEIQQYEMVYEQYGIGMPSNAENEEVFVYENGKYHIKNMHRVFPVIKLRNGKTVSKHRLIWGENAEHQVFFNDYFSPGEYLTIQVSHLSLWERWKGVKIHD
ncbi:MAG TPA: DUF1850 domain-containing protein [Cerasibacillus sp.]|uniref:DUF1850 domain-containing protein n=1 Tax=Cerasibacillus sp. TaxID=2498711 RepID=UPI002F419BE6